VAASRTPNPQEQFAVAAYLSTGVRSTGFLRQCDLGRLPLSLLIKLWDITSLGSVQVVGFFDVAARLRLLQAADHSQR